MNALVKSIAENAGTVVPTAETTAVMLEESKIAEPEEDDEITFAGERMINLGMEPIKASLIDSELKTMFETNDGDYVTNLALINEVGNRIVDELELAIRMLNPASEYKPEWLEEAGDTTILSAIINRDDLASLYKETLMETYDGITEDIAEAIVAYIAGIVSDHEYYITEHYNIENGDINEIAKTLSSSN